MLVRGISHRVSLVILLYLQSIYIIKACVMYLYFSVYILNTNRKEMIDLWKRIEVEEDESQAGHFERSRISKLYSRKA